MKRTTSLMFSMAIALGAYGKGDPSVRKVLIIGGDSVARQDVENALSSNTCLKLLGEDQRAEQADAVVLLGIEPLGCHTSFLTGESECSDGNGESTYVHCSTWGCDSGSAPSQTLVAVTVRNKLVWGRKMYLDRRSVERMTKELNKKFACGTN